MTTNAVPPADWPVGGGEMGARIRGRDWSATPLGPLAQWPPSLRAAVAMLLPSRAQIVLFWGPDFIILYNDAYRPVFGSKHPTALGQPGREAWSEIWEGQLGPLLQGVVDSGEAFWASDLLFCIQRHGYLEETYFDISYDPVRDDGGRVAGVNCIVAETTGRVVGQRRLRTLSRLGQLATQARTVPEVLQRAAQALDEAREDIAFALLYEWDGEQRTASLRATSNIDPSHAAASAAWPFSADLPADGAIVEARDLGIAPLPGGKWPEPCERVVVLPAGMASQSPDAFVVVGASPRRAIDDAYRDFLGLVAAGIGSALSNAQALAAERRRGEALAELDRAKTAFFSNISHEFRTPLTLLLGPLRDELDGDALAPATRHGLEVAHRNGLRLLRLVNALLDFSRIEAGRMRARFEPTDLAASTRELASHFEAACARAGLAFRVECQPLPGPAYVDRDMWEKIVLNLLSNAFKYTFEGGIEIRLEAAAGEAVMTVRDTGVGIPAEAMPRLFERFRRVEGTRARTHEGSGIGLAMVHELVRTHGGAIRAESRPGEGTLFEVRLPLGSGHLPQDQVSAQPAVEAGAGQAQMFVEEALGWLRSPVRDDERRPREFGRERVLVAEDNADMREYIERLLGESWEVVAVSDGEAAIHELLTGRFDLLLTDVMMPRMDGFALLRAVRSDEALREMPVVMLSARAGEEARIEGRDAGADDYLVKPFSARELVAQVRAHLAMARARRAVAREREMLLAGERSARMDAQRQWDDLVRLFEQAPNPMVILRGREHVIDFANPAACRVWGRTQAQVLHRPLFEALPEAAGQGLEELLHGVLDTGEPVSGRIAVSLDRGSGQETIHFDFVYSPLRAASGRVDGVAVTAFDVTERVKGRVELAVAR